MLAYLLALIVGLSSVALYMAAFFFPEVHRKHDFIWSGVGAFYALVLWICAGRITGGVLLGQTASVVLLGWLGWQTLTLRRQVMPTEQQTAVPTKAALQESLSGAWASVSRSPSIAPFAKPIEKQVVKLTAWIEALVTTTTTPSNPPPPKIEPPPYVPLTPADFANAKQTTESAAETIAAEVTPVQPRKPTPSGENPLAAIAKQVQGIFKGATTKPESKPVYVRRQFRTPEAEIQVPQAPVVETSNVDVSDRAPEPATPEPAPSESVPSEPVLSESAPLEPEVLEVGEPTITEVVEVVELTIEPHTPASTASPTETDPDADVIQPQ